MLPNAFARHLGARVWLNSPIIAITNGESGVTIRYRQQNEEKEIEADYYVNCIPLPVLVESPVTQPYRPIDNMSIAILPMIHISGLFFRRALNFGKKMA